MLYGLREYRGEPHRVEPVGILNEVEYFDDSKGTNVGATVAALSGLGADRRLVVILGGDGKGQDFAPLARAGEARYARAVVLIGRDAPLIRAALAGHRRAAAGRRHAARGRAAGRERAHAGDAVLMSPACASFDMFDNYAHRAQVFVRGRAGRWPTMPARTLEGRGMSSAARTAAPACCSACAGWFGGAAGQGRRRAAGARGRHRIPPHHRHTRARAGL